jgi:hypothetical protein
VGCVNVIATLLTRSGGAVRFWLSGRADSSGFATAENAAIADPRGRIPAEAPVAIALPARK